MKQERDLQSRTVYIQSDLGWIYITGDDKAVREVDFVKDPDFTPPASDCYTQERTLSEHAVNACAIQLLDYLEGKRTSFDLPLQASGTAFQQRVWNELMNIGWGETKSYGDIAHALGSPKSVRAVGGAIGRNPISIIVPCHRVIGSNGKLTGYAGELWRKEWLLKHESLANPNG